MPMQTFTCFLTPPQVNRTKGAQGQREAACLGRLKRDDRRSMPELLPISHTWNRAAVGTVVAFELSAGVSASPAALKSRVGFGIAADTLWKAAPPVWESPDSLPLQRPHNRCLFSGTASLKLSLPFSDALPYPPALSCKIVWGIAMRTR